MRVNLASVLSGRPLLISDQGLRLVFAVISRDEFFAAERVKAMEAIDGEPLENAHAVTTRDGVACIPIHGPLFRFGSFFTEISGATSYDTIRKDLQTALADPGVQAILLDVNSPGGDADGCGELAEAIRAACAIKPVWAYVGGMGASAAYWIASSADRIVCAPSAFLGSIGVRTAIVDTSKAEASAGVREIEIISSNAPGKRNTPVDDEIVAKAQKHVDALEALFVGAVAENRGVTPEVVMSTFGGGDIVIGGDAVTAGMADALGNYESTLAELAALQMEPQALAASNRALRAQGENSMSLPKNIKPVVKSKASATTAAADPKEPGCEDPTEPAAAADDPDKDKKEEEPGAKADDDADPAMSDDDDGEKAALSVIAKKHGLSASATKQEILTAAAAGSVPLERVEALVAERFAAMRAENEKERAKAAAHERAVRLAEDAKRGGADGDLSDLTALAEANYEATERSLRLQVERGRKLFAQVTAGGAPIGAGRPATQPTSRVSATTGVVKDGSALSAAITAYRKQNPKASFEQAARAVAAAEPSLVDSYLSGQ
jgi:ClpP class serine protease/plasmid stability protein